MSRKRDRGVWVPGRVSRVASRKGVSVRQANENLTIGTKGPGLYEFTPAIGRFLAGSGIREGLLTLYCRHTSCSLLIQENADPDVQTDFKTFFSRLVPEGMDWIVHTTEGPDDMPAHIRSALTQTSLSIPVVEGRPVLGTWQGVYLFEHRRAPHQRQVVLHVIGED